MARRSTRKGAAPAQAPALASREILWAAVLVVAVVIAYWPAWVAGYIWDDDLMVTGNPVVVGPLGLREIWTTQAADICPLTLTTFRLEYALWGLAPLPYHLVNVALHAACAVLLWRVLIALRVPGAWLGAALWALHPVMVESVAWIAETKNTESCLFYLLAILFFVRSLREPHADKRDYGLALLFTALAMTAKTSTIVLPVVLSLCAWWVEGRVSWRTALRIGPILLLALAAATLSIWTQSARADQPQWDRTWPERLVTAGDAIWFYLGKLAWPQPLSLVYPRWQVDATQALAYLPLATAILLLALFWFKRATWGRSWFFAFGYFIVALTPELGLINNTYSRFSLVADHFQYLAAMGPLALAAAGATRLAVKLPANRFAWLPAMAAVPLLVLGILTLQRGWVFQNSETLWTNTVAKNPTCWEGWFELGIVDCGRNQFDVGADLFRKSIDLNPRYFKSHFNLGLALDNQGQTDAAIDEYTKAMALAPDFPQVPLALGETLLHKGDRDGALAAFEKAPDYAPARYEMGLVHAQEGHLDTAAGEFEQAIALDPGYTEAREKLALVYIQQQRLPDAAAQLREVVRLHPESTEAQTELQQVEGMMRSAQGR